MNKKLIVLFFAMTAFLYLFSLCQADFPLLSFKVFVKNNPHPGKNIPKVEIRHSAAGSLDFLRSKQYYAFTLQKPCRIRLNVESQTKDSARSMPYVRLYNDKFQELSLKPSVGQETSDVLPLHRLPAGTYYASVCRTAPFAIRRCHFRFSCQPA